MERFPYRNKLSGLTQKDREIVRWALSSTGMTELADREMDQLSGGQRQRGWDRDGTGAKNRHIIFRRTNYISGYFTSIRDTAAPAKIEFGTERYCGYGPA